MRTRFGYDIRSLWCGGATVRDVVMDVDLDVDLEVVVAIYVLLTLAPMNRQKSNRRGYAILSL